MVLLRAYFYRDEFVAMCTPDRFATRKEVRPGAADGIFEGVGYEGGEEEAYKEPEDCDVGFVETRFGGGD